MYSWWRLSCLSAPRALASSHEQGGGALGAPRVLASRLRVLGLARSTGAVTGVLARGSPPQPPLPLPAAQCKGFLTLTINGKYPYQL